MKKVIMQLSFVLLSICFYAPCYAKSHQLADQYWDKAEQLNKQGNYLEAAEMYVKSAEAEQDSLKPRAGYLCEEFSTAGLMYKTIGRNHEAMNNLKLGLLIARKIKWDEYIAVNLSYMGDIYQAWGQSDEAVSHYKQALAIERKIGRDNSIAINLNNIGMVYQALGKYDTAIDYFEQALAVDRKSGREGNVAIRLNNIGMSYRSMGKYDTAISKLEEALAIDRKSGRDDSLSKRLNNIGAVYKEMGQYNTAIDHFEEALVIDRKLGRDGEIAVRLNNIGGVYEDLGQYDKAFRNYEQALAIDKKLGRESEIAICLSNLGKIYKFRGQYDTAIDYFEEALAIGRKLGMDADVANRLNNIGAVYEDRGQYDKAINNYKEALAIARKLGSDTYISTYLNNIGMVYLSLGQYDKAISHYEQAQAIDKKLGRDDHIALRFNNIGMVYMSWGQYDKAIRTYEEALSIERKMGREADIATTLNNIGAVYELRGQYDKAIRHYEQSLAIDKKLGRDDHIALCFNNIGMVYMSCGQYDNALRKYEEALSIFRKLGREADIAGSLNNIGGVYQSRGQNDKALRNFEQALVINKKLGRESDIALCLDNIGGVYYLSKDYDKAIHYFKQSVKLKEKLRKTATGSARRDYLASQIDTYQYLIDSYFEKNDLGKAFETIELSRAKLLAESLAESQSEITIPSARDIQRNLTKDTAVITYANENLPEKIVIGITKDTVFGVKIDDRKLIASIKDTYEESIATYLENQRGIKVKSKVQEPKYTIDKSRIDFAGVINYYRGLLTDPSSHYNRGLKVSKTTVTHKTKYQDLNIALYGFLIKPVERHIEGKKNLLIIPDGYLGLLPFETLRGDDGKYLIENYNVSYSQSMGVSDLISRRKYKDGRKPMLAFGGAEYNQLSYSTDMIQTEKQLEHLENNLFASFQEKRSVRNAYESLELAEWSNLPGTLSEVKTIKKLVSGARIVTGDRVTENYVKRLSEKGDLKKYKVIHFATHGLVVPEMPELSAIVLSQFEDELNGEDGYLRLGEIAKLNIKADLVTLSACETGLGKIYRGEGVVGLNQSFLIAGANGLSVSLWQVADRSTSTFMVTMYGLVETEKLGYGAAINEVKRKFIAGDFGDEYRAPYYWAPFVYYGQTGF